MKKIIDGKLYNTETAVMLCFDRCFCCEPHHNAIMYVTKKGNFFIQDDHGDVVLYSLEKEHAREIFEEAEIHFKDNGEQCNDQDEYIELYRKYFGLEDA